MNGLSGKSAVVTGGAQGIGRAIATELAAHGVRVSIIDIQSATETLDALEELGNPGIYAYADVCDFESFRTAADHIHSDAGDQDFLVNNAGGAKTSKSSVLEMTPESWHHIITLNLTSVLYGVQLFCPGMVKRHSGAVVNIASTAARFVWPNSAHYNSAKTGVVALTRTLALELEPSGVRVNCVSPAQVDTPAWPGSRNRDIWDREAAAIALGRLTKPVDVARVVMFLLSQDASGVTGTDVLCDGGYALTGQVF
jgi:3-oxoacyl-[acyl-carrier protein] reductase